MTHSCEDVGRHIVISIVHREPFANKQSCMPIIGTDQQRKKSASGVLLHKAHSRASPKENILIEDLIGKNNQIPLTNFSSYFSSTSSTFPHQGWAQKYDKKTMENNMFVHSSSSIVLQLFLTRFRIILEFFSKHTKIQVLKCAAPQKIIVLGSSATLSISGLGPRVLSNRTGGVHGHQPCQNLFQVVDFGFQHRVEALGPLRSAS